MVLTYTKSVKFEESLRLYKEMSIERHEVIEKYNDLLFLSLDLVSWLEYLGMAGHQKIFCAYSSVHQLIRRTPKPM
jgi:hypothetical protein